jgi:protein TonB
MCFYTVLLFAIFYAQSLHVGTEQKPQEQIITFKLSEYEPAVIPPEELPIEEPEPVEEVEPEEPVEEEVLEEVIPEPVVENIISKPKPIAKQIVKKKVQKKKVKKKYVKKKTLKRKPSSKRRVSPAKKNAYLARIRAKINKNKTYPRIAQRRGMQGSVKVRFTILKNGRVGNISVSGSKVFHKSAKSAVKKSFPISVKNAPISLPTTVNFTLRYQIR